MSDITRILTQIESGDPSAADQLLPLVYDELRKLAAARLAQEKPGQTLQATALVHEAWLKLVGPTGAAAKYAETIVPKTRIKADKAIRPATFGSRLIQRMDLPNTVMGLAVTGCPERNRCKSCASSAAL